MGFTEIFLHQAQLQMRVNIIEIIVDRRLAHFLRKDKQRYRHDRIQINSNRRLFLRRIMQRQLLLLDLVQCLVRRMQIIHQDRLNNTIIDNKNR